MTDPTSRRRFLRESTIVAGGAIATLSACSSSAPSSSAAAARARQAFDASVTTTSGIQRELVRFATLAPSSHNTQCWRFELAPNRISILPDLARRTPAVDPDDHHMFVSLGCAAENLVIAAQAHGLKSEVSFEATDAVRVRFTPARPIDSPLYRAITSRQCTRAEYDGSAVRGDHLRLLEAAAASTDVRLLLLTARADLERVLSFVVAGNTAQMHDARFMAELTQWIRFSDAEAVATGDGLFSRASGNASLPRWLAKPLLPLVFTTKNENDKYAKFIRSSAGIAVFVSASSDKLHWVAAGRSYERFVLAATALGIRTAMINQPVEIAAIRPQFAADLGLGALRPDLVVRFGYGPEMPRSLRRAVQAVIA